VCVKREEVEMEEETDEEKKNILKNLALPKITMKQS